MSTHNICFHSEIKKYQQFLVEKYWLIRNYEFAYKNILGILSEAVMLSTNNMF